MQRQKKSQRTRGAQRPKKPTGLTGRVAKRVVRPSSGILNPVTTMAPTSFGLVQTNGLVFAPKFGAAAPHQDFPEGGVRLSGQWWNTAQNALTLDGTNAGALVHLDSTVVGDAFIGVSPTAFISAPTTAVANYGLFGASGSTTAGVSNIAQYFQYYRFRKLYVHYETETTTASLGSLSISYHREPQKCLVGNVLSTDAANNTTARFSFWTPQVEVPCIEDRGARMDDPLFICSTAGDGISIAATETGNIRYFQGVLSFHNSAAGSEVTYGRYKIEYVLDLYGFQQFPLSAITLKREGDTEEKKRHVPRTSKCYVPSISSVQKVDVIKVGGYYTGTNVEGSDTPDGWYDTSIIKGSVPVTVVGTAGILGNDLSYRDGQPLVMRDVNATSGVVVPISCLALETNTDRCSVYRGLGTPGSMSSDGVPVDTTPQVSEPVSTDREEKKTVSSSPEERFVPGPPARLQRQTASSSEELARRVGGPGVLVRAPSSKS